jgi:signal transduction histidine kinase
MLRRLDIHGYHDKAEGPEKLLLWIDVALKAYAQLERVTEAERLKSDILNKISHEFRTPLNVIIGYSDMLGEGGCGAQSADALDTIGRLRGSAAVLLELINDFLDMSRLEAGAVGVQLRPVSLQSLGEDLERAARGLLQHKPVAFRWHVADAPPVLADRTKLRVVLYNLLVNAVKFTSEGEIVFTAGERDGRVWIAVRDTGMGIDPEDQGAIFEAFRQGRRTRDGGTGLGLAIARGNATLMGGDLSVVSTPGAGSTFTLTLQRAVSSDAPLEEPTKSAA